MSEADTAKLDVAENIKESLAESAGNSREVRVRFDDASMHSSYANVANVGISKDEVSFLFGVNSTWGAINEEVVIELSQRVIMTTSVARSYMQTLQRIMAEYDRQAGERA
jgi:hypothetical protein